MNVKTIIASNHPNAQGEVMMLNIMQTNDGYNLTYQHDCVDMFLDQNAYEACLLPGDEDDDEMINDLYTGIINHGQLTINVTMPTESVEMTSVTVINNPTQEDITDYFRKIQVNITTTNN